MAGAGRHASSPGPLGPPGCQQADPLAERGRYASSHPILRAPRRSPPGVRQLRQRSISTGTERSTARVMVYA